ncbi:PH and SEC7 domain-containing protein 4 isoform X4 [Neomonachus schauinslandi]|uniref:PH and SEC7 domain-containing protein 4 n=1 Tax=Neomonachus schauinslandi TaxID=29088 RepID=A0A2Y9HMZ3_NEOSC|nr:PH and SEC7 domain-containing protein 4 isoform X4 [Neomonachus schauinslandi]
MGDDRLSEHPKPMEFLNLHLGDNLQPGPGAHLRETCSLPDPPEPRGEQTWASEPPERPDALPSSQGEPRHKAAPPGSPGNSHPLGNPRQGQSTSTQVVFWAGILQAQMCVLDLEEELEKTEGLRAELRCCLPAAPVELPPFPSSPAGPRSSGVHPSSPVEAAQRGDSSGPEAENQHCVWPREGGTDSSPEWGAEEESVFFDNPLFLESPRSDTSASGARFSWGLSDSHEPQCPQILEPPLPGGGVLWELASEPGLGDGTADYSGRTTPSFPVPIYKPHSFSWTVEDEATKGTPEAPPDSGESETSLADSLDPAPPAASCADKALAWETGQVGSDPSSAVRPVQPWALPSPEGWQTEEGPSWPQVPLISQDRDGAEPRFLEKEEAGEAPQPGEEVRSEGPARTPEAGAVQPGACLTSAEGLPESPMPQAQSPEEGQRPQTGDKLANGVSTDKVACNLASRLYHLEGFRKSEVAAYLQKNNDFSRAVAEEYLSFFQFGGQSLDRALRDFLQALVLSGETQERERILYQFSKRFHYCNPGAFSSADSVHTLTCAVMLLNTDLHGQNIGKSMSYQEFITNLNGLRDGGNFPKELLKALYWSIRSEKLEWAVDEEDAGRAEKAQVSSHIGKMSSPFLQLAQNPTAPTYKQGILARKMHHDADGKKTPWGKRGWKMFHTLLRGMVLYFLKGEDHCPPAGESLVGQMVDEPVGVHHSLATPATHYTKKPHVFQLRTADWRLYLFQAPTAKEMSSWIARINLAAATHSAPPFPAAVGSQRRFVRPILPVGPAQSSLEEQHRSHENCLDAASDDLLDLQRNLPERRGRSRELEDYRLRKEYLEYEKTRYETYVQLLVARLRCPSDDLDLWEEQLGREAGGTQEPKPSLKKSHSSPSLHQEEAPTTAKVKRNISERRTYRKIIPKRNRNQL